MRLLTELGALADPDAARDRGSPRSVSRLAALPLDPRLARMLLEAERQGCLREMLVIVSGLSIVDPRERPADAPERADALHRRFWSPISPEPAAEPVRGRRPDAARTSRTSWPGCTCGTTSEQRKTLSGNGFRRMCRAEYLHFLRIREWQDLHGQLKQIVRELD